MTARALPACVLVPLLIVAIVVSTSACGTIASMLNPPAVTPDQPDVAPIYGGVRAHVNDLSVTPDEKAIFAAAFDLPLCVVADTLLLPATVFLNVREAVVKHMASKNNTTEP